MRVITGSARGHPLKVPRSAATRPTPARAKEAMFSSLGDAVIGARVLDLFAGSGAFGIEALSRGSAEAVFVEADRQACLTIEANLQSTRLAQKAVVMGMDAAHALESMARAGSAFDIIFADPPYLKSNVECRMSNVESSKLKPARRPSKITNRKSQMDRDWKQFLLQSVELKGTLAPEGYLLVEYDKRDTGLDSPYFKPQKDFRFGDTVITLLRHV